MNRISGIGTNQIPDKIVGSKVIDGNINYVLKWKDVDEVAIFESEVVKNEWPQVLIQYLESITVFSF